jgi:hypothetical protein
VGATGRKRGYVASASRASGAESSPDEKIRLNLVVNQHVKSRIERLQEMAEDASITEVIRRALAVYEELLKIREEGGRLVVENRDTREILRVI